MQDQLLVEEHPLEPAERLPFPWRVTLLGTLVLLGLVMAVVVWQPHPKPAEPPAPGESHLLGADKALCLRVGVVLGRSTAYDLDLRLGLYGTLDPAALHPLEVERSGLRQASTDFPTADVALLHATKVAAAATSSVVADGHVGDYIDAVSGRAAAIFALRNECVSVAGFDTSAMEVMTG